MKASHTKDDLGIPEWWNRTATRLHMRLVQKAQSRFRTYGLSDDGKVIETASWAPTQVPTSIRISTRRRRAKAARAARKNNRSKP